MRIAWTNDQTDIRFQGQQIMARIKAKPMNRLPIAPVQMSNKSGFAPTPPPPVYDPTTAFAASQPRFAYANGAAIPQGTVAYGGQVHMFVSIENGSAEFVLMPYFSSIHIVAIPAAVLSWTDASLASSTASWPKLL